MSTGQFHRFTYFFHTDARPVKSFFDSADWKNLPEKTGTGEIRDLKIYRKGADHFMVVDASPTLNHEAVQKTLKRVSAFQALQRVLSASAVSGLSEPLERIYELEQQKVYLPEAGQLKNDIVKHKRFVWTLLLEPNLIDEYKRVHAMGMAWPEITDNLKTIGVKDMEIYLHGSRAILIMDTQPDFDLDEVGPKWHKMPRENEWQAYVAKFQRTDPKSSIQEKWQDMIEL